MIIPLIALLMVTLLGILAIVMDLGQLTIYRAQLQNAADAAALAGASALGTDNLIRPIDYVNQTADLTAARQRAEKFAEDNAVNLNGTVKVVLDSANDVDGGRLSNPSNLSQAFSTSKSAAYNSIRVRTFADDSHSGRVQFLFAPVLGMGSTSVQMTATATVELHQIAGMKAISGYNSPILPITMSYSDWKEMVENKTGVDDYKYDPTTKSIVAGSDGLQEQQLYPGSNGSSSNNGLLQFGVNSHSDSVLSDQIVNGPTADQMRAEWPPSGMPNWSPQHTVTIGADPGWRASDFDSLAEVVKSGLPRLIPLNDGTPPGNGANASYNIVAFAPVRVVLSEKGGSDDGRAWVQPAVIDDPTLVYSSTLATPGQGGIPVVRLTR